MKDYFENCKWAIIICGVIAFFSPLIGLGAYVGWHLGIAIRELLTLYIINSYAKKAQKFKKEFKEIQNSSDFDDSHRELLFGISNFLEYLSLMSTFAIKLSFFIPLMLIGLIMVTIEFNAVAFIFYGAVLVILGLHMQYMLKTKLALELYRHE